MSQLFDRSEALKSLADQRNVLLKEKCKRDRLFWLKTYVKTIDEHDPISPVKLFPDKPYIAPLVKIYEEEQIINVEKSRQIMASWLFGCLGLHEAQFFDYRLVLIISKKQEDAFKLVQRVRNVYAFQPQWLKNLCPIDKPIKDQPQGHLMFKNGSHLMGLPQGADQVRSHTASLILVDEAAFQDELEQTLEACAPSIFGGGKLVVFSSANPGAFQKRCEE